MWPLACRRDGFLCFQTSKYKLHYYETPTGLRFVLTTDLGVGSARDALQHLYSNVSVPHLGSPSAPRQQHERRVRSPTPGPMGSHQWGWMLGVCAWGGSLDAWVPPLTPAPPPQIYVELVVKNPLCPLGEPVQSELFRSRLDAFVRALPFFSARAA